MPKGTPNPKPTPPSPAAEPAPMILLQPTPAGLLLNAYGLMTTEIIEDLRLALVHLVATQSGVQIVEAMITRQTAVKVPSVPISPNGWHAPKPASPAPRPSRLPRKRQDDEDLDRDEPVALMEGRD